MRRFPYISETCYEYEEALPHVEEIRRTGLIILGGDVLTPEGKHAYINWYYNAHDPETACNESCDHAAKFISELANRESYLYAFVVSTYEEALQLRTPLRKGDPDPHLYDAEEEETPNDAKTYYFGKDVGLVATCMTCAVAWSILGKPMRLVLCSVFLLACIFLTHRKCYPFFAKLIISDTHVEKAAAGYSFARLSRDHLQVSIRQIRRRQFIVFSSVPTAHLLLPDIRKAVQKGKAIMYPVTDQMREDFPQFFQGKILPA